MLQSCGTFRLPQPESLKLVLWPLVTSPRLNFQPMLKLWPRKPFETGACALTRLSCRAGVNSREKGMAAPTVATAANLTKSRRFRWYSNFLDIRYMLLLEGG